LRRPRAPGGSASLIHQVPSVFLLLKEAGDDAGRDDDPD
jgi:hypothetical protein